MNKIKQEIEKECKRIEEDSIHTAKALFNLSDAWNIRYYWLGVPTTILAAIVGAMAFSQLKFCTSIISILVAILSALTTFLNPNAKSNASKNVANNYNKLKKDIRIFYEIDLIKMNDEDAKKKIKDFASKHNKLTEETPNIPQWARRKAKEGIEKGEANYKIDNE